MKNKKLEINRVTFKEHDPHDHVTNYYNVDIKYGGKERELLLSRSVNIQLSDKKERIKGVICFCSGAFLFSKNFNDPNRVNIILDNLFLSSMREAENVSMILEEGIKEIKPFGVDVIFDSEKFNWVIESKDKTEEEIENFLNSLAHELPEKFLDYMINELAEE